MLNTVVVRVYLFLTNTYKYATQMKMYLFVLISAKLCLKCTYITQKLEILVKFTPKSA